MITTMMMTMVMMMMMTTTTTTTRVVGANKMAVLWQENVNDIGRSDDNVTLLYSDLCMVEISNVYFLDEIFFVYII